MSKCKVVISASVMVADTDEALELFRLLSKLNVEKLNYDYISRADSPTGESQTLHYLETINEAIQLSNVTDEDYAMWKLYTASRGEKK